MSKKKSKAKKEAEKKLEAERLAAAKEASRRRSEEYKKARIYHSKFFTYKENMFLIDPYDKNNMAGYLLYYSPVIDEYLFIDPYLFNTEPKLEKYVKSVESDYENLSVENREYKIYSRTEAEAILDEYYDGKKPYQKNIKKFEEQIEEEPDCSWRNYRDDGYYYGIDPRDYETEEEYDEALDDAYYEEQNRLYEEEEEEEAERQRLLKEEEDYRQRLYEEEEKERQEYDFQLWWWFYGPGSDDYYDN